MRFSAPRNASQPAISAATSGAIAIGEVMSMSAVLGGSVEGLRSPFLKPLESARPTLMATRIVDVLVPVALDQTYSYQVAEGLELAPGDVVCVPLGARGETTGVVWAENDTPNPRLH